MVPFLLCCDLHNCSRETAPSAAEERDAQAKQTVGGLQPLAGEARLCPGFACVKNVRTGRARGAKVHDRLQFVRQIAAYGTTGATEISAGPSRRAAGAMRCGQAQRGRRDV